MSDTDKTTAPVAPVVPAAVIAAPVVAIDPKVAIAEAAFDKVKAKADALEIGYSNSITIEALSAKIEAFLKPAPAPVAAPVSVALSHAEDAEGFRVRQIEQQAQTRQDHQDENMALVRCRITNMNPTKADLKGEIITISNKLLGTVRRYVPYKGADAWHVEKVMLDNLRERTFQQVDIINGKNGSRIPQSRDVPEFAIEILPALTEAELKRLAAKQAAQDGKDDADE